MKISNLLSKDFKIVERKKILFLIPACIVAVAIVCMIIYGCVTGSPLNLGLDFSGGYSVNVKLGPKLTDDNADDYENQIREIVESLTDENGKNYGIKPVFQRQGSGDSASIYVKYKAVADEAAMEDEINPALRDALQEKIFKIVPTIALSGTTLTASYGTENLSIVQSNFAAISKRVIDAAAESDLTLTEADVLLTESGITVTHASMTQTVADTLTESLKIDDSYSGQAITGDMTSATVSSELLINALLAISLATVLMLVYIAFRFEVSSGLSAIVALLHDIIIMFSFMAIFHIELNSTFIAALITILGYSINNTIIIFDRIREHTKSLFNKESSATFIANKSVQETILRSINTTFTTLLTIGMIAILGVPDIRIFALPIIIGLLAGTYSSICIAPSVWATWKDRKKRTPKAPVQAEKAEKAALA